MMLDSVADYNLRAMLGRCSLFEALSEAELTALGKIAEVRRLPVGAALFEESQPSMGLWVLAAGRVKICHSSANGRDYLAGFKSPPTALGLLSLHDGRPHALTAIALEPVTALLIQRSSFSDFARYRPVVTEAVVAELSLELRRRDIIAGISVLKSARERLACRLVQIAREYGEPNPTGICLNLPLSRRNIGASVGVGVETTIRTISEWQQTGLLTTNNQIIEIHHLSALQHIAECGECQFDCSVFGPPPASTTTNPPPEPPSHIRVPQLLKSPPSAGGQRHERSVPDLRHTGSVRSQGSRADEAW
jgi:CRP-like cAMP-binding protein